MLVCCRSTTQLAAALPETVGHKQWRAGAPAADPSPPRPPAPGQLLLLAWLPGRAVSASTWQCEIKASVHAVWAHRCMSTMHARTAARGWARAFAHVMWAEWPAGGSSRLRAHSCPHRACPARDVTAQLSRSPGLLHAASQEGSCPACLHSFQSQRACSSSWTQNLQTSRFSVCYSRPHRLPAACASPARTPAHHWHQNDGMIGGWSR